MLRKSGPCRHAVSVCLSVRLPTVTFVNCVKMNNRIFKFFSLSGSQTILVFRIKRHGNIPTGTLTGRRLQVG